MKFLTVLASTLMLSSSVLAANEDPLWMRYPQISPDGQTIAFTYKGDIFTVPAAGGRAVQLTTHPDLDTRPVWSPDGKKIAFASNRKGNYDIYVVNSEGGAPRQLTTNSANEMPEMFFDNEHVLFNSWIMPDVNDSQFPSGQFPQIYKVDLEGGRPEVYSALAMESLSINKKGDLLYQDKKGYEDEWRKHHTSSIARDIWMLRDGKYTKITSFKGEDRNPVWTPSEDGFYYLSEEKGTFNVFRSSLDGKSRTQLTKFTKNPVRFLSSSKEGVLCFGYDGEIYTMKEGQSPKKVKIQIVSDVLEDEVVSTRRTFGASDIAVSPDGKEIAFILRGDVFVTAADYSTTKRITDTPQQERDLSFSPDGRSIVYSSERAGVWGIYRTELVRKEDKMFTYAHELKEEALVQTDKASFQPAVSPDGKEVAFLENRTTLRVVNIKSKKVRTVLDGKFNYSYADGDQAYQWSPDSKWFLSQYIGVGGWQNSDIVLVKADGSGEMTNLTESGYVDENAKWVLGGKAMIWSSDRAGFRSHGSWGAQRDYYIMFFDGEAYDKFLMSKEDLALYEEAERIEKEEKAKAEAEKKAKEEKKNKKKDDKKKDEKKVEEEKTLKFDLENRRNRIVRLTPNSSFLADGYLNPAGDKFYYCSAFESGFDLWMHDLKEHNTRLIIKGVGAGALLTDKKGSDLFLVSRGEIKKIMLANNQVKPVSFAAEFNYRPAEEREYIFNHAWQQVKDKFYDPQIHGIDWAGFKKEYAKFLPHINNNTDFAEMLSELLGELNASHTGASARSFMSGPQTAVLGAFYDEQYKGDGLKIAEIIKRGPLTKADSKIVEGCIIEQIDGEKILKGKDYYPMLANKAGKRVMLKVYDPAKKEHFEQEVKPISRRAQADLLYRRWVEQKREMVDKLSGGKVGYVHVKGMDSESFREVYSDLLGMNRDKISVIVDTRHNGGGWLHEDLCILLSGKLFGTFEPRGQYIAPDPFNRWTKPSCVLVCEDNYSNAHGFPWAYQTLKIGKLIGAPVPGTMTAVWWENQIDPTLVFGIPQVGMKDMNGKYLENQLLIPDIEVYNSPESQLKGEDEQLARAVKEMLAEGQAHAAAARK